MFLTPEEIADLTDRKQKPAQARALRALGIEFKLRANGSPVVLRAHVVHLLGGEGKAKMAAQPEPNWGALASPASR